MDCRRTWLAYLALLCLTATASTTQRLPHYQTLTVNEERIVRPRETRTHLAHPTSTGPSPASGSSPSPDTDEQSPAAQQTLYRQEMRTKRRANRGREDSFQRHRIERVDGNGEGARAQWSVEDSLKNFADLNIKMHSLGMDELGGNRDNDRILRAAESDGLEGEREAATEKNMAPESKGRAQSGAGSSFMEGNVLKSPAGVQSGSKCVKLIEGMEFLLNDKISRIEGSSVLYCVDRSGKPMQKIILEFPLMEGPVYSEDVGLNLDYMMGLHVRTAIKEIEEARMFSSYFEATSSAEEQNEERPVGRESTPNPWFPPLSLVKYLKANFKKNVEMIKQKVFEDNHAAAGHGEQKTEISEDQQVSSYLDDSGHLIVIDGDLMWKGKLHKVHKFADSNGVQNSYLDDERNFMTSSENLSDGFTLMDSDEPCKSCAEDFPPRQLRGSLNLPMLYL